MSKRLQGSKVMRQSGVDTLITEEPDDRIGQVRICGGDGQQWPSLPGILPILDVYFGPKPPPGKENNWVQTIPGKGWNTNLRFYGPLQPWFDKTWRPGEIEFVE